MQINHYQATMLNAVRFLILNADVVSFMVFRSTIPKEKKQNLIRIVLSKPNEYSLDKFFESSQPHVIKMVLNVIFKTIS